MIFFRASRLNNTGVNKDSSVSHGSARSCSHGCIPGDPTAEIALAKLQKASGPLELEPQIAVSYLMSGMGIKPGYKQ